MLKQVKDIKIILIVVKYIFKVVDKVFLII